MADENERRLSANGNLSNRKIMWKNFIGGISWGVGSAIGATVIVAIIVFLLKTATFAPVVGEGVTNLINGIEQNQVNTLKKEVAK